MNHPSRILARQLSFFLGALIVLVAPLSAFESSILHYDNAGERLIYHSDEAGNRLMDFSYAGYHNGDIALPTLPVVHTISPISGDNTAHIQAAINYVGSLAPDANGHRGALLLNPGTYEVASEIFVNVGGVVVRGSGEGSNPSVDTIIRPTGTSNRRTFVVGTDVWNGWNNVVPGTQQLITSDFIAAGSRVFEVANGNAYSVGDNIIIKHPATDAWLSAVNYGDTDGDPLWGADVGLVFNRFITRIEGDLIEVDVPIYHDMDRALSEPLLYVYSRSTIITECGVENLRIDIETQGQYDNNHADAGVSFIGAEDCWAKDVTVLHFDEYGFDTKQSTRVTVLDCTAIEPHSVITGGKRSSFMANDHSNNILFKNCYGSQGRHILVTNGGATCSGIVFTQCTVDRSYAGSESHRRWGSGIIWDDITYVNNQTSYELGVGYNRGSWGTGHGWTGTGLVAWNVTAEHIIVQRPPIGQNYAIGCTGRVDNQGPWVHEVGYIEGTNQTPSIQSLYEAQLAERLTYGLGPNQPIKLTVTHYSNTPTRFTALSWIDTALDEDNFILERSSDGGNNFSVLATLPAGTESYSDTTVSQDGTYVYRIHATNTNGFSAFSNLASVDLSEAELVEPTIYQAETYSGQSGCTIERSEHTGFTSLGFVDMGAQNSWFELTNIDGGMGGTVSIRLRYSMRNAGSRACDISVNGGTPINRPFNSTGSWSSWGSEIVNIAMEPGMNTVRITASSSAGGPNIDRLEVYATPLVYSAGDDAPTGPTSEYAFDSNNNTVWTHASPQGSWLQRAFTTALTVGTYTLTSGPNAQANDPASWTLLGSNNGGSSWTVLDSRTGQSFSSRGQTKSYTVSNSGAYKLYRLDVSAVNDLANADSVQLAELGFTFTSLPPVTPDPAGFAVAPYPISGTEIQMTATTGLSAFGSDIEYYFTETSGNAGGSDSGWITSSTYTDTGLSEGVTYTYTVMMRDLPGNEGTPSSGASATTFPPVQTIIWDPNPGSDGLWTTGANWNGNVAPMIINQNRKVVFNQEGAQESVLDTTAVVARLVMGDNGTQNGTFLRLTTGADLTAGKALDGSLSWTAISYNRPATLTVETGASFKAEQVLYIGRDGTGASLVDIQGGSVEAVGTIRMGNVAGTSTGTITIDQGGVLKANNFEFNNSSSVVDLRQGALILDGDQRTAVANYISAGNVLTSNGSGTYSIDYDNRNAGKTTVSVIATNTTVWNPGGSSDALWTTGSNWTGGSAPIWASQYLKVVFNVGGAAEAIVDAPVSVAQLVVGDNGTTDGNFLTLRSGAHLQAGGSLDGKEEWTAIGYNRHAMVTVEAGALFETAGSLFLGFNGTSNGVLRIHGGQVNVASTVQFGHATDPANGYLQVAYGGQLIAGDLDFRSSASYIDVRQGSVLLVGDQRTAVASAISAGAIVGYGGSSALNYDYNQSHSGYTTITAVTPSYGYERWTEDYGFLGAPDGDHDGDKRSNLYEYAFSGDPSDPAKGGSDPGMTEEGGDMLLKHRVRDDDNSLVYTVYAKTDLTSGTWQPVNYPVHETVSVDDEFSEVSLEVPTTEDSLFLMVDVTMTE